MTNTIFKIFIIGVLTACLIFCDENPEYKIIQYQEEVKLSDGSMIWVDIKRHYGWSGYAPGMGEGAYLPGAVEISWDTGFEGVGRYTMTSDVGSSSAIFTLDKYDSVWYIALTVNRSFEIAKYGNKIDYNIMVYALDKNGNFVKTKNIPKLYSNIMHYDINDSRFNQEKLARFNWQDKISFFNNDGLSIGNELYPNLDLNKQ